MTFFYSTYSHICIKHLFLLSLHIWFYNVDYRLQYFTYFKLCKCVTHVTCCTCLIYEATYKHCKWKNKLCLLVQCSESGSSLRVMGSLAQYLYAHVNFRIPTLNHCTLSPQTQCCLKQFPNILIGSTFSYFFVPVDYIGISKQLTSLTRIKHTYIMYHKDTHFYALSK